MLVIRNMRIIIITILLFLAKSVMACSCGWGEYFYTIDSLVGTPEEPHEYYLKNYGVKTLEEIKSTNLMPVIEDHGSGNLLITVPISERVKGNKIRFILDSEVSVENDTKTGFANKSIFSTQEFMPRENILEITGKINSIGNKWKVYILVIDASGKIVAKAHHAGQDTCGTDIYVSTKEKAKELDSKRNSGCFQTWGYYKE